MNIKTIHRGWLILLLSVLTGLACLGLGRFSYGAILPFMKAGLNLNYIETGWVTSSIFLGYVLCAFFAGYFVNKFSAKKVIIVFLWVIFLGMIATSLSTGFISAYLSSFFIGIGSGGANVASMGVVSSWFSPRKRGMALGILNAGNGLGIVFSGVAVPIIVTSSIGSGWRISWVLLATLVLFISILNIFFLKSHPGDAGVFPVGSLNESFNHNASSKLNTGSLHSVYKNPLVWTIGICYFLWGFSYIMFTTFLVDFLIDFGLSSLIAGRIFAIAGFISIISGFLWGSISDRLGRLTSLSLVFFLQMLFLLGFSFSANSSGLIALAILYSITLWGTPAIILASTSEFVSQTQVSSAIGFLTLFFGIGQLVGPIIIGYILNLTSSYSHAFLLSALSCFSGSLISIMLHHYLKKAKTHTAQHIKSGV
ncbi:MFS transporter [Bacillus sp. ISL-47]|uniref:MFS transporter n=1 Tax=Bacillus sp. ISL-47 TaxID=2819130 RepID=UPI001BE6BC68|nr:MFS transporter [Bacillus sp. ISL-47]MBT2711201.1 MFS transporter [Pseudomonas sp. ISL-84]